MLSRLVSSMSRSPKRVRTSSFVNTIGPNADAQTHLNKTLTGGATLTYFHEAQAITDSSAVKQIFIGSSDSLAKLCQKLPPLFGTHLKSTLEYVKAGRKGASNAGLVGGTRVATVVVPTEASRHNCPSRPDCVAKTLTGVKELTDEKGGESHVHICCPSSSDAFPMGLAVARAMPRFSRKTDKGKDKAVTPSSVKVFFHPLSGSVDKSLVERMNAVADGIRIAAGMVDAPPNELNCTSYKNFVRFLVEKTPGVKMTVIEAPELKSRGMGGILSVGRGQTVNPPCLVSLSYTPPSSQLPSVALVGKGIVYDTGGLAIKGRDGMCGMKRDMGGSAGMLGAFFSLVRSGVNRPLHAVLCLAENSVGPESFRNDDIIRLYSGLTVEINNTDAEGRLVLADGVTYAAKDLGAEYIVDMATLTGAQGIATGHLHASILSSCPDLEKKLEEAGRASGDLVHPLLYCPELHQNVYVSSVADMKNSVSVRTDAQVSCAGFFVHESLRSIGFKGKWAHVDMAYPVHYLGERASGYGVGLINELLGRM